MLKNVPSNDGPRKHRSLWLQTKLCEAQERQQRTGILLCLQILEFFVQVVKDGSAGQVPGIFQLVIPAELVEETINELLPLLSDGDIVIDRANSNFKDSRRNRVPGEIAAIQYIDCGTSGGGTGSGAADTQAPAVGAEIAQPACRPYSTPSRQHALPHEQVTEMDSLLPRRIWMDSTAPQVQVIS